jgi:hypothetical protein
VKKLVLIALGVTAALAVVAFVALAAMIWATDNPPNDLKNQYGG